MNFSARSIHRVVMLSACLFPGALLLLTAPVLSQETSDAASPVAAGAQAPTGAVAAPEKAAVPEKAVVTEAYKETPIDQLPYKPYDINVVIGFDGREMQSPHVRERLVREIRQGLQRMYGPMWTAQVAESDWFAQGNYERLNRILEADVTPRYPATKTDKVILLAVAGSSGQFQVSCREYDARVEELSPIRTESTYDSSSLSNMACRLARDSFRPVMMLSGPTSDKTELEFFLQAGTIVPPDPSAAQIVEGDVLRTFLRQMDRRNPGTVKLLQKLDLCYIRVTTFNEEIRSDVISPEDAGILLPESDAQSEAEPGSDAMDVPAVHVDTARVRGVLIAHGMVPFGGRGRSLQQIALRQRPSAPTSRVKLVLRVRPDRPLICYRVDRVSKLLQTDANADPPLRFLTDRNGDIEISVDENNPTYWLYVYSGSILLARVPYAPGLLPEDIIKLPDDTLRLGVEGELYLLRDQLVDMVAQKAVFMSLAKKAAAEGNEESLEEAIAQLDGLPGQKHFLDQLNRIQTPAVNKADQQKNASGKRSIEKLCGKMNDSLTAFFTTEKRVKEAEELEKLRQSAAAGAK